MDWDIFRKACESLHTIQFKGMVGIMGGEPTLHPEFDRFLQYYDNVIPNVLRIPVNENEPIDNINLYQQEHWNILPGKKRGLWTSFGPGYAKHFELIRHIFEYQCINDHKSSILHQVSMLTRKELNISDDKWIVLRDNCWLQNNWSASITPKGAFFCEIAGALDMLFDGPGGWPIEAGWWQRTPKEFGDQLNWCEMCSFCLKTPYVKSHYNTDVVSPVWNQKLEEIGSKKKRIIFDVNKYNPDDYVMSENKIEPYMMDSDNIKRIGKNTSRFLSLNKIVMVTVCTGYSGLLAETLFYNKEETDEIVVVTEKDDTGTIELCKRCGVHIVFCERKHLNKAFFNKGAFVNDGVEYAKKEFNISWILLLDADITLPIGFKETWVKKILNPGTLYYADRINVNKNDLSKYIINPRKVKSMPLDDQNIDKYAWGYFQLFNLNAKALKGREKPYSEDFLSAGYVDGEFLKLWHEDKRYFTGVRLLHINHGEHGSNWNGIKNKNPILI